MLAYLQTQWRRIFGLNVSALDPLLFVGGQFRADQWPDLHAMGIRAVLSLQAEREDAFVEPWPTCTLRLLVQDFTAPSLEQLTLGVSFISRAHADGLPVLVHCHAGVGRAPIMAAAYLVANRNLSPEAALAIIRKARPIIGPGPDQIARLHTFADMLRQTAS